MSFKEKDYQQSFIDPKTKILSFLNEMRTLLDNHKVKLYVTDCEIYIDGIGFVGNIEDNIETLDIVDGEEILYTSS